jgi:hypothetical protein
MIANAVVPLAAISNQPRSLACTGCGLVVAFMIALSFL